MAILWKFVLTALEKKISSLLPYLLKGWSHLFYIYYCVMTECRVHVYYRLDIISDFRNECQYTNVLSNIRMFSLIKVLILY